MKIDLKQISIRDLTIGYEDNDEEGVYGYNGKLELQYRGRMRELKELKPVQSGDSDLLNALKMISKTSNGPKEQIPSMGCNIKWIN